MVASRENNSNPARIPALGLRIIALIIAGYSAGVVGSLYGDLVVATIADAATQTANFDLAVSDWEIVDGPTIVVQAHADQLEGKDPAGLLIGNGCVIPLDYFPDHLPGYTKVPAFIPEGEG